MNQPWVEPYFPEYYAKLVLYSSVISTEQAIVMQPVSWLHISDLHLRNSCEWAQDIVLQALCKDIEQKYQRLGKIDFILATGDLAFSGKASEYELTTAFFDEIVRVSGVPRERIFCVPGNHDVDRDRQKMCFAGARHSLQSENEVDVFLGSTEEISTLLLRQENYYHFQESYFAQQERLWTPDRLGYVSLFNVENLQVAILGLNTAWLAEGGLSDQGRLLVGERQVIDALDIAAQAKPHLIIAMGHHPFRMLNEFDARPVQRWIEEECHFFHCGHFHNPEVNHSVRRDRHCLTVTAGATFESRKSHNAYSLVSLNLMSAESAVKTIQYQPTDGTFAYESTQEFPFIINSTVTCEIGNLGKAIETYCSSLSFIAYYLAALLLERKREVLIPIGESYAFCSFELLSDEPNSKLKEVTTAFMELRNPLRLLASNMLIGEFLTHYGNTARQFGTLLTEICAKDENVRNRIAACEADARALAGIEPVKSFTHTLVLFQELAAEKEWDLLRQQAERYLANTDAEVAIVARRMMALAMSQSEHYKDRQQGAAIYKDLINEGNAKAADIAFQASLLLQLGNTDEAKEVVFTGIRCFPEATNGYIAIGQKIVEATGDRNFRDKLNVQRTGRSSG
ncbi:MAG: metallophosphoesterase family protein [Nodosilinea sp.]